MARKINNTMTDALLLVGSSVLGAGMGLLFAPNSGRKTRAGLVCFGKGMGRKSNKAVRDFSANISGFADKAGDGAADILHSGQVFAKKAKKSILTAFERGQDTLEHQKCRLGRMIG